MSTFKPGKIIGFDTEGTGLDVPHRDAAFAVALVNDSLDSWYCEWDVDPKTRIPQPPAEDVRFLNKILGSKKIQKVAHNTPYDILALESNKVLVQPPYQDSQLRMQRAKANEINYKLKRLAKQYLDMPDDDEKELKDVVKACRRIARKHNWNLGEKVEQDYWLPRAIKKWYPGEYREKLPKDAIELCEIYCVKDAERTLFLYMLLDRVIGEKEQAGYEKEMRLMPLVLDMQHTGWQVYPDKIKETRRHLLDDIAFYKRKINQHSLIPLDKFTNATEANLLYNELGIKTGCKCEKCQDGKTSVDRQHLEKMNHPAAQAIIDMRDAEGCITKFLNPFENYAVEEDDELVVYPQFRQSGARTFRFSATRPPIQTIPDAGKSKSNMSARQCIGPRKGYVWYMIDYSSLQVRIFADLAKDETMLQALRDGIKPHAAAARMAWNGQGNKSGLRTITDTVSLEDYDDSVRHWCESNSVLDLYEKQDWQQIGEALLEAADYDIIDAEDLIGAKKAYSKAKTVFFAKLFGAGAKKISEGLKCSMLEARRTIREYEKAMPRVVTWSNEVIKHAQKHGYVETPYGDVIHIDPGFEYRGVNYIVQGTEAALVKDRMIVVGEEILPGTSFSLLGQIHDELAFAVPEEDDDLDVVREIKTTMEDHTGHFEIEMPCEVDRVQTYWNERVEIEL